MATEQTTLHIRVNKDIKDSSEAILDKIGISMSDLVNMTLRRVIYERRIPFDTEVSEDIEIDYNDPNLPECMRIRTEEDLIRYIEEGIAYDKAHPKTHTLEEVREHLNEKFDIKV